MNIFTKILNYFTKYYTIYWGVQPYLSVKDKATLREEKTLVFKLIPGKDTLYYSYPLSFGKLSHICRIPPAGSMMPIKDVMEDWSVMILKDYIIYSYLVKAEQESVLTCTFSFIA